MKRIAAYWLSLLILLTGCTDKKLFHQLNSAETGITFANRLTETDSVNVLTYEYMYNGAGVGVGDFNNDGLQDLYFAGNQVSSRLYMNRGGLKFDDITDVSHTGTKAWCTGVSVADVNQDGWSDIYVCVAGPAKDTTLRANKLFINNGPTADKIPRFSERAAEYGLNDMGLSTQAAFFDYDRDGDLDCYVLTNALETTSRNALRPKRVNGEAPSTDRLYRNNAEKTRVAKNGMGPESTPAFENVSRQAGILIEGYGLGLCVSDLDDDGWLDVYCANDFLSNDLIWINGQRGQFQNQAGAMLKHQTHNGMGVDIADFNNDALPDIIELDMLPENNYRQKMMLPGSNYNRFQMDLQQGYQPQYMRNTLQLNRGRVTNVSVPTFSDISQLAGVSKTDWSWAPLLADLDNDGHKDLFITNGYRRDVTNLDFIVFNHEQASFGSAAAQFRQAKEELYRLPEVKIPNYAYRNKGDLTFADASEDWGLNQPGFSNGAAYADLDNDGDLDIVTNNIDDDAFVLENQLNQTENAPHWLRVSFERATELPSVIGTKAWLYAGGSMQMQELTPVRGYVSSVEDRLHFGLGSVSRFDSLVIRYPNGQRQVLRNGPADQLITVSYQPSGLWSKPSVTAQPLFAELSSEESGLQVTHEENPVVDFNQTPLLPHQYSQNGPGLTVSDINGDQLDDFFMGTDFGKPSLVYLQQPNGQFRTTALPGSDAFEDTGATFFDADGDGDQDLYVVSGGSRDEGLSATYQDRLYLNLGNGTFSYITSALPPTRSSGSCVVAADFDGDGDQDLFRGGRIIPGQYPKPADSYLLRNESSPNRRYATALRSSVRFAKQESEKQAPKPTFSSLKRETGGEVKFTDVTDQLAPGLRHAGMVTAALWTDVDNDHQPDLLLAGEWMSPTLFKNMGRSFAHSPIRSLSGQTGWWCSLLAHDFDGDGDTDFVAGNLGLNGKFRPTPEEPVRVYASDYDQNGRLDPILTYYLNHEHVPVAQRDVMMAQIPGIKKRYPTYHDYASHPFEELFSDEERNRAFVCEARQMASCYIENQGTAGFVIRPLPIEAQMAPVNALRAGDFTGDGKSDLLLAGNFYGTETIGGQYDAGKGLLLSGNGKGSFTPVANTGLNMDKDAKALAPLRRPNGSVWWLVANNNGPLQVWQQTNSLVKPRS